MWGKVQPETQEEVPEEVVEGLQPGSLEVGMYQGLSLITESAGISGVCKTRHIHTHADNSMQELPT